MDEMKWTSEKIYEYLRSLFKTKHQTDLGRFFELTGDASQVHLGYHCDAPGMKNSFIQRLSRRSSQADRRHMRTRL